MAKVKSAALEKLIERNFAGNSKSKESQKKKVRNAERKARRLRRNLNKGEPTSSHGDKASKLVGAKPIARSAEATEIENLKNEIAKELESKATYVKRQYKADVPMSWEGLTPGLAPVGYDPDESDSDEDPY